MGDMRNVYKILVGKPERKRPFGRPGHRWKRILECMVGKCVGKV
jgi:hypothetical protein